MPRVLIFALVLLLTACGSSSGSAAPAQGSPATSPGGTGTAVDPRSPAEIHRDLRKTLAFSLLGLDRQLRADLLREDEDIKDVVGTALVEVTVDPDGVPLTLSLGGRDIESGVFHSQDFSTVLDTTFVDVDFAGLGDPVSVPIPEAGQLVTAAELG